MKLHVEVNETSELKMANERLSAKNVEVLLAQYREERRRLLFQLENVRETIGRLKELSEREGNTDKEAGKPKGGTRRSAEAPSPAKRSPGRPRKTVEGAPVKTKRRKKRARTGGYRLNPWDEMVINTISKEGMLRKETLVEKAKTWAMTNAKEMSAADIELKVTRVLQKLSGVRGVLATHRTGLERGYHYGLKEWFFSTTGAIRPQHLDKLVLKPRI